jgi:Tol biopolymer transport system component
VSFAWSRNGAKLAYFSIIDTGGQRRAVTCVVDANNYGEKCLDVGGGSFALSPDGTELAINDHGSGINIISIDSGEKRILTTGESGIPDWSPDGTQIVYQKGRHVYSINADGTNETRLVSNASSPIWSPDGTHIAYIAYPNIILMKADGTEKVRLTSKLTVGNEMIWSSDGKHIVFLVMTAGDRYNPENDIYVVEVESKKLSRLTKDHNVESFTLSPDGTTIAYTVGAPEKVGCGVQSYLMSIDGAELSEWKTCGTVGPWRPKSGTDGSDALLMPTKGQAWEFESEGNAEGWMEINDLVPLQVGNGNLLTESKGADPYMHSPKFGLDAIIFPKIEIRMKISAGSSAQLFFITDTDATYDETKVLYFKVVSDKQFHTYTLDMSKVRSWYGIVRQIRLDPTETLSTIEIDYIRITKP